MEQEYFEQRLKKITELREKGINAFPKRFVKTFNVDEILANFKENTSVKVAGRLTAIREHGKSNFCDLKDQSGRIQLYIADNILPQEDLFVFKHIDIGDIIGVEGELFKTRREEPTIKVTRLFLLTKSLRPLPEKWHGLKDIETRYRQRYLDLIANVDSKKIFLMRSKIVASIRNFLDSKGYLEVETPMLHPMAGGAAGQPFKTYHNALNATLYMRIAPELYLKRLLVGGFEKIYELNRSFRNEGISVRHNPEFTMLEVYTAYVGLEETMQLTKDIIMNAAKTVSENLEFNFQERVINLNKWETVSFANIMKKNFDINPEENSSVWIEKLKKKGIKLESDKLSRTQILKIIEEQIDAELGNNPVFVVDMFTELCPLSKTKDDNRLLSDRFELFLGGMEVANAYSELNNPIEQRERLLQQSQGKEIDEDFVKALEHGMPPAGGLGIGVDRLTMILTNSPSIRDVVLFPQLKSE